jgi:hypothetical protein
MAPDDDPAPAPPPSGEDPDDAPERPSRRERRARRAAARATPRPGGSASRSDYMGCGLWALGFVVLVCISFAVGIVLRPEDDPTADLTRVGPADGDYELVGSIDEVDDPCVTLYDGDEEVTGQCGVVLESDTDEEGRYGFTSAELSDGSTVAFGPVPRDAASVVIELSDGSRPEVPVKVSDELDQDIQWFALETDLTIAEGSEATLLDINGNPVTTG